MDTQEIDKFMKTSIGEIADLPIDKLSELQNAFERLVIRAEMARQWLTGALMLKYSPQINEKREANRQPYGEIKIRDHGYLITENRPLSCEWDKAKLKKYAERIRESGGNPEDYIDISYTVSEQRYFSLVDDVRENLNKLCTLKPCQSQITIEKCEGNHE